MQVPFSPGFFQVIIQISIGMSFCCAIALLVMLFADLKNSKLW